MSENGSIGIGGTKVREVSYRSTSRCGSTAMQSDSSSVQRVRMAAIRGLGQIGSTVARATFENTATNHEDPATRRRAAAEVELLDTSSRRSLNATEKGE